MFDEAGVRYPDGEWTWKDFVEIARKLTQDLNGDGRIDRFGFCMDYWYGPLFTWVWSNGGTLISPDGKRVVLDVPAVEALQFVADLSNRYGVSPKFGYLREQGTLDAFASGLIGMYLSHRATTSKLREVTRFDWDVAPIPRGSAGRKCPLVFTAWSMSSKTKYPQQAWKLISYLAGPKGTVHFTKLGRDIPALTEQTALNIFLDPTGKPTHSKIFIEALNYAYPMPQKGAYWIKLEDHFTQDLSLILLGGEKAEDAAKRMKPRLQQILDEFWEDIEAPVFR